MNNESNCKKMCARNTLRKPGGGAPWWYVLGLLLIPALPRAAHALVDDVKQPIQIEADQVELDEKRQISTYSGRVTMVQGSVHVQDDTVTVTTVQEKVRDIVARGKPARFRQRPEGQPEDVEAEALEVIYRASAGSVTLRGDALMSQGQNVFRGEHIFYDMTANLVRANGGGSDQGRVRVTIDPNSVQRGKNESKR